MHAASPLALLLLLALALGSLFAMFLLMWLLRRGRRSPSLVQVLGAWAIAAGAAAVWFWMPPDREPRLRFETVDGRPALVRVGGLELGLTPLELPFPSFFEATIDVPRAQPLPPDRAHLDQEASYRWRGLHEAVSVSEDPTQPGPLILRCTWGAMRPGRSDLYSVEARHAHSQQPARLEDVDLVQGPPLGMGPRTYRVILRLP